MSSKLRIIGGDWRSRQIKFDDAPGLRPTPSRVRETLFNWLQADVPGSRCLDLFAGSGALSFEAAPRGAKSVVMVDSHGKTCRKLQENVNRLGAGQISVRESEALSFLSTCSETFDLVFLDPPFGQNLLPPVCQRLADGGMLAPHAKIYLEMEKNLPLVNVPIGWHLLKQKSAGEVAFCLYQFGE